MILRLIVAAFYVFSVFTALAQRVNGEATYISFSVPGAQGTYPMSINASTTVTGYYYVSPTATRGFIREVDGTVTTFAVSGAIWTEPESINADGEITGFYEVTAGVPQGFLRRADGAIKTFNPPKWFQLEPAQALPISINEFGDIAGSYPFPLAAPSAFTLKRGVFETISARAGASYSTVATSMNWSGAVVGYFDSIPGERGFVAHPDGYWSEIVVPLTNEECANADTIPEAINAGGTIAGWYLYFTDHCATMNTGGFVVSSAGALTTFTLPGTLPTLPLPGFPTVGQSPTVPHWISLDDIGDIAGSYKDAAGIQHGFVRNPYGTITAFDPPEGKQTYSTGINNLGEVAGYYSYSSGSGAPVGFIRIPKS